MPKQPHRYERLFDYVKAGQRIMELKDVMEFDSYCGGSQRYYEGDIEVGFLWQHRAGKITINWTCCSHWCPCKDEFDCKHWDEYYSERPRIEQTFTINQLITLCKRDQLTLF